MGTGFPHPFHGAEYLTITDERDVPFYRRCLAERIHRRLDQLRAERGSIEVLQSQIRRKGNRLESHLLVRTAQPGE